MLQGLLGEILSHGVAVALSPIPIVAVILILFTPNARHNGLAFMGGWVAGLVIVSAIVIASGGFHSGTGATTKPSMIAGIVKLAFGLLFLGMAVRRWYRRTQLGEPPKVPRWISAIDKFTLVKAAAMGVFLSGVNPKNLALTLAMASHVAGSGAGTVATIGAIVAFVVIASATIAVPVLAYLAVGDRVQGKLERAKEWLLANNDTVMIVLLVVFGVKLVGNGAGILLG